MQVLIDKSYRHYDNLSRYATFPYYYHTVDNKYIYGVTSYLDTSTSYVIHTVKSGDTLDKLALEYYNTPLDYWIIADFNRIQDPFKDLEIGQQIKIPTIGTIRFLD